MSSIRKLLPIVAAGILAVSLLAGSYPDAVQTFASPWIVVLGISVVLLILPVAFLIVWSKFSKRLGGGNANRSNGGNAT